MNWRETTKDLANNYANASYLVSEENHHEIEEVEALRKLLAFIETLLEELIEEIPDEIELSPDELDGIHRATKSMEEFKQQLKSKYLGK